MERQSEATDKRFWGRWQQSKRNGHDKWGWKVAGVVIALITSREC